MKQVNQMAKIFELEKEISKQREVLTKYVSPLPTHKSQAAMACPSHTHTLLYVVQNEKGRVFDRQSLRQHTWRTLNAATLLSLSLFRSFAHLSLSFAIFLISLLSLPSMVA